MKAAVWMAGALLCFSMIGIGARELSGEIPVIETLFFRSLTGLLVLVPLLLALRKTRQVRSTRLGLHATRNLFHLAGQYGWFVAIGFLPLAEVFALEFTVPIWTAVIAALALKETLTGRKLLAIGLGFLGVVVIVRPGLQIVHPASLLVLAAALCYAICHSATKGLSTTDRPSTILFYMFLIQMPVALVLALPGWIWPEGPQWFWLAAVGLAAMGGHFCMATAMAYADVTRVVTLDFLRLPLIALVGVLFYSEPFDLFLLLGGGLMLLANLVNAGGRRQARAEATPARR